MTGQRFDQYVLVAPLGAGGMGEVFRARDTRLDREVALKLLPKSFASDPDRLRRFQQEAKTLAALNHPNVLTIHDAGVHEGAPYLVSELLQGRTLREVLAEGKGAPLPLRQAIDYAVQLAQGLAAAHNQKIIHRDLKPENIFVTKDGRLKVLDFGLAKLIQPEAAEARRLTQSESPTLNDSEVSLLTAVATEPGLVLGTPAYMSPEQVRGEPADERSDIFSFGCVLYEMLSGKRAFKRNSAIEAMNAVMKEDPLELTLSNPNLPPALDRVVRHCLEKQPTLRFQTAQDAAFALETIGQTATTVPPLEGTAAGRRPMAIAAIAGLATLALLTTAALLWFRRPETGERSPGLRSGPLRALEIYLPLQPRPGHPRQVHEAELSPDARALLYADGAGLWLKRLDQIAPAQLISTNQSIASPFWSPDSASVGWFEAERLFTRPATGGQPQLIGAMDTPVDSRFGGGVWLRDGRILCANADGPLFLLPARGGPRQIATPLGKGESDFHKPSAAAGREGVFFPVHGAKHIRTIGYWDPKRGRKDVYTTETDVLNKEVVAVAFAPSGHLLYSDFSGLWTVPFSLPELRVTGERIRISEWCRWASFADDGTLALPLSEIEVFERLQPVWVNRSGQILSPAASADVGLTDPHISPDESQILYITLTGGLQLVDPVRKAATRLLPAEKFPAGACFDRTGQTVIYSRNIRPDQVICSLPLGNPPAESQITPGTMADFTRDSQLLLFVSMQPSPHFRWLRLDSTNRLSQPLPGGFLSGSNLWVCMAAQPRLSPNGRAIAYVSYDPGREGIYCARFPECDRAVLVYRGAGRLPRWRSDGAELFFIGAGGRQMWAADVAWQDGTPQVRSSAPLFPLPDDVTVVLDNWIEYDVAPRGDRFLMLARAERIDNHVALTPALHLLENWTEELKFAKP